MSKEERSDETIPVTPEGGVAGTSDEGVSAEYAGKTSEELIAMLQATKQKLGEQGKDLGEKVKTLEERVEQYRHDREDEQRLYGLYSQQPPQVQQQVPPSPQAPQFDYERPGESVSRIIDERERQRMAQAYVAQIQQAVAQGQIAYQQGRQAAFKNDPVLYQGIERDVEQRIYAAYSPIAKQGVSVKEYVGDPAIWRKAAQNVRLEREEYDYLKPKKSAPMRATQTELPQSAHPVSEEVPGQFDLDTSSDEMRAFERAMEAEGLNLSPEERKKILKEEQDRFFRGDRW